MDQSTIYFSYPSFTELIERAHDTTDMALIERVSREGEPDGMDEYKPEWFGATWAEASKLALAGDIQGAKKLQKQVIEVVNSLLHDKPRLDPEYRLDEGHWIDVSRYVKGEPECWGAMVESKTMLPRRGIALMINIAVHADISASTIEQIGIQIGGTILALQTMGYAVTLYVGQKTNAYQEENYIISAPLNPNGVPLDMSKVSIILRPWFLRRIIFSLEETYDKKTRFKMNIGHGYGVPRPMCTKDILPFIPAGTTPVIVNINAFTQDPKRVQDYIIAEIKKGV